MWLAKPCPVWRSRKIASTSQAAEGTWAMKAAAITRAIQTSVV